MCLSLMAGAIRPSASTASDNKAEHRTYIPTLLSPETLLTRAAPIWPSGVAPNNSNQVALFRATFNLTRPLENAQLQIFADTRYDAWIDGFWVGRGPARFSRTLHEFDVTSIGTLFTGQHIIAVRVQFAPNTRRSESQIPHLVAHIQGTQGGEQKIVVATDTSWKAQLTDAWRSDSPQVHSQALIGPSEILDFSRLPVDWNQRGFNDRNWAYAIKQPGSVALFQARSIPSLMRQEIIPSVSNGIVDAGTLSPGNSVVEILNTGNARGTFNFYTTVATNVRLEMLGITGAPQQVLLNGNALVWQPAGAARPDVYVANAFVGAGAQELALSDLIPYGTTVIISKQNVVLSSAFTQGVHAGRRLLLANPVSNSDVQALVVPNAGVDVFIPASAMPGYVVIDLGRTTLGRVLGEVSTSSNTVVDVGWDERLLSGTKRVLAFPGSAHPEWNQTDSWAMGAGTYSISSIDARAGRYLILAVWGSDDVTIHNLRVEEERYPTQSIGSFVSSNEKLNKIWQVGATTAMVNMSDAYADPWRERGQWWGDAFIVDHVNRVAFGDYALLRRGLMFVGDSITPQGRSFSMGPNNGDAQILDYGMLWVQSLADYVQLTNDIEFAKRLYPKMDLFLDYLTSLENRSTGLINVPAGHWSKTALIDWYAYYAQPNPTTTGQSAAVNAMYYGTLQDAAVIAGLAGDPQGATQYRNHAKAVQDGMNNTLFVSAEKRYISSLIQSTRVPPYLHAQAWALAYDVPKSGDISGVVSSLMSLVSIENPQRETFEIYGTYWILEALAKAKRYNDAVKLITNYYYPMIERWGATTWWESFDINRVSYTQSLSHGWGSSPTWFLTTHVAGIRQTSPGTWVARPPFSGVSFVDAALPLGANKSILQFRWDQISCQEHRIRVTAPANFTGEVVLPYGAANGLQIKLNSTTIWVNGTALSNIVSAQSDGMHIRLTPGNYDMVATRSGC